MSATKTLKLDIIEMLVQVEDIEMLENVHHQLEEVVKPSRSRVTTVPDFREATTDLPKAISLEEIMKEQNYHPITYQEYRKKVDTIEWEESLEELLEALSK